MYAAEKVHKTAVQCMSLFFQVKDYELRHFNEQRQFPNIVLDEEYQRIFRTACRSYFELCGFVTADVDLTLPAKKYNISVEVCDGGPAACISSTGEIKVSLLFLHRLYLTEAIYFARLPKDSGKWVNVKSGDFLSQALDLNIDVIQEAAYCILIDGQRFNEEHNFATVIFYRMFGLFNFVYCHELGHFVSGHCGVAENLDLFYGLERKDASLALDQWTTETVRSSAREFSCDMYATMRGMLNASSIAKKLHHPDAIEHVLNGGSVVITNLSRGIFNTYATHPSAFSRLIAHLAVVINSVAPIENAVNGFRPAYIPWEIEYDEHGYARLNNKMWAVLAKTYDKAIFGLTRVNGDFYLEGWGSVEMKCVNICASLWRIGYGDDPVDIEHFAPNDQIRAILQYSSIEFFTGMRDLCTYYNGYYAGNFPKGLGGSTSFDQLRSYCRDVLGFEGGDFYRPGVSGPPSQDLIDAFESAFLKSYIVDPAYQCLDSIFSNIQAMSDPERKRLEGMDKYDEILAIVKFADVLARVNNELKQ